MGDDKSEVLNMNIGSLIINFQKIDHQNVFQEFKMMTGPGCTLSGESLFESNMIEDKKVDLSCIVSFNRNEFDKSGKELEEHNEKMDKVHEDAMNELKNRKSVMGDGKDVKELMAPNAQDDKNAKNLNESIKENVREEEKPIEAEKKSSMSLNKDKIDKIVGKLELLEKNALNKSPKGSHRDPHREPSHRDPHKEPSYRDKTNRDSSIHDPSHKDGKDIKESRRIRGHQDHTHSPHNKKKDHKDSKELILDRLKKHEDKKYLKDNSREQSDNRVHTQERFSSQENIKTESNKIKTNITSSNPQLHSEFGKQININIFY